MPAPGEQHIKGAIPNPFDEPIPHISEYTAIEIATLQSRLDKQLGPEYISKRAGPGGGQVHYLAAEKVINLANEVFGFNGWSSSIQKSEIDFVDVSEHTNKVTLGMSVIVRVTLRDGTFHEDMGYGHIENCKGKAPAFEKARKEAVTDALKRALRSFGKVLGNCLYDKDYLSKVTKIKIAPSRWDESNLHRHPDYRPLKKEHLDDQQQPQTPARIPSRKSTSQPSEFEDDFGGGGLFDGVELAPDDASTTSDQQDFRDSRGSGQPPPQGRPQGPQRVASMPAAAQTPEQGPQQGMPPPHGPTSNARPQPPVQNQQHPPPRQQPPPNANTTTPNQPPQPRQQPPPNANTTTPNHPPQQRHPPPPPATVTTPNQPPQTRAAAANNAAALTTPSFVSSRAVAKATNEALTDTTIAALPKFNPAAESPSIKRTPGVDHTKSAAVGRAIVGQAPKPELKDQPPPPQNGAPPQRPPPPPQQQANANAAPQQVPPQRAPPQTNFVNPGADPGRKIGMPMSGNRSPYKPPTGVKRPAPSDARTPLADVSNATAAGAAVPVGDGVKRTKLSG